MKKIFLCLLALAPCLPLQGEEAIEDNSFLIEEAFNQEVGVVQHVSNLVLTSEPEDLWAYSFTQEWPFFSQRHQLSYAIPVVVSQAGGDEGLGDVLLNYRYQTEAHNGMVLAPRLSLILPTGDEEKGLGDGSWGLQANLPMSRPLSSAWIVHANLGATWLSEVGPATGGSNGQSLTSPFAGLSLIWLAQPRLNVMLEVLTTRPEELDDQGRSSHHWSTVVSPGLRWALDRGELQIVPGVAVPITFEQGERTAGLFLYLSFEHPF